MLDKRILIKKAQAEKEGNKVVIAGWIKNINLMSKLAFIGVRDASGFIQIVAKKDNYKDFDKIQDLTRESVVVVSGEVVKSKLRAGGNELIVKEIEVLSKAGTPLPIDVGAGTSNIDTRIDHRFLDTREERVKAIFKIRSKTAKIIVNYFDDNDFFNITTPKLTSMGVESGAELFNVKYFKRDAFLSQSPQIYKQMFVAGGFEKVYEIAPVFRAEKSRTSRHLTEFTGVDMEMGFIKDENDVMDVVEEMFKNLLINLKKECPDELKLLNVEIKVPKSIPRIPMGELKEMLEKKGKKLGSDDDLDSEAEKMIGEYILEKFGEEFVFVTNYPWEVRPFYHMKPKNDPNGTNSFDLLWNGVEIATGAQREHRYDILKAQATEKGVDLDAMEAYAEIFKFGCPPHGGIGLGIDRIVQRFLKLDNIREAILLPRDPDRLTP